MSVFEEITIKGSDEAGKYFEQTMPAEIYGGLALHVDLSGEKWTITHIGTGFRARSIGDHDVAVELAKHLSLETWNFTDPDKMPGATRVEAVNYIRQMRKLYTDLESQAE